MCTATKHAYERAKKRLNWKPRTLDRMLNKAFEQGIKHKETKGLLNKFITKKRQGHPNMNNPRIYGENLFLFSNHVLITVYRLNNDILKLVNHHRKNQGIKQT